MKARYDKHIKQTVKFQVGEQVLLYGPKRTKLETTATGPFRIRKANKYNSYELELLNGTPYLTVTSTRLQHYKDRSSNVHEPLLVSKMTEFVTHSRSVIWNIDPEYVCPQALDRCHKFFKRVPAKQWRIFNFCSSCIQEATTSVEKALRWEATREFFLGMIHSIVAKKKIKLNRLATAEAQPQSQGFMGQL
ncbi:5942_t:CDS:2 [Paraglomus occultum]|uniref:5942_t:CDS:1 n=1 Tax=Paraglomus occultum TaxID=144539 RepID=A0A9N9GSX2_9GLOM|nr:5942_t:CDS:2 [Paraglomus occultum]